MAGAVPEPGVERGAEVGAVVVIAFLRKLVA
jgi:hypothetical protein